MLGFTVFTAQMFNPSVLWVFNFETIQDGGVLNLEYPKMCSWFGASRHYNSTIHRGWHWRVHNCRMGTSLPL